jgi:hypothetical protein
MTLDKSPKKSFPVKAVAISAVLIVIFAVLYAMTLTNVLQEGKSNALPYAFGNEKTQNGIVANYKVLSIDPVKGEVSLRVDLTPQGSLTDDGGFSANQNLKVYVNGATGQLERTFDKGKAINPFDMVVSLDGQVNEYPFDQYSGYIFFNATSQADKDAAEEEVPVVLNLTANVPGFTINAAENTESNASSQIIDLSVTRSSTVSTVAIAGMIIMWAIAIAVIFLTMTYVFSSRKPEAFAFYSGLLFGLFGLRNSLPGTPPIGTTSDFLSFIWVEAIVAIMMVVVITVSLVRPQK